MLFSAASEQQIERIFHAALSEMGGMLRVPTGRAQSQIDSVADVIIEQVGGTKSSKVVFKAKIVAVERKTVKGHVYGEVVISANDVSGVQISGLLKIPFKNENIVAIAIGRCLI
ncbi:hypothetical protein GGX14DRAFT_554297 [Mycena pura]|uniref:S-Me-THD-like C-terminal domain-containing protein n=1 Tax=Mycena pura TaxID=153505 RepID=A0AAD7E478_9AGAR|nr:hypothetical protein GGX14DRAFT_554297 [Mycena pura]